MVCLGVIIKITNYLFKKIKKNWESCHFLLTLFLLIRVKKMITLVSAVMGAEMRGVVVI
jgi:hypothetical protein